MNTVALTNQLQAKTDRIIQAADNPLVLIEMLSELIGNSPSENTLSRYIAAVENCQDTTSPDRSTLEAATALQRHKMIEYGEVAATMKLNDLVASLPYLSLWEYRIYHDEILDRLTNELDPKYLFTVIPPLREMDRVRFTQETSLILNKYFSSEDS